MTASDAVVWATVLIILATILVAVMSPRSRAEEDSDPREEEMPLRYDPAGSGTTTLWSCDLSPQP